MKSARSINWHAYPALLFAACIGIGIASASFIPEIPLYVWIVSATIAATITAANWFLPFTYLRIEHSTVWTMGLFLFGICAGSIHCHLRHRLPSHHLLTLLQTAPDIGHDRTAVIRGQVISFPQSSDRYIRFTLAGDTLIHRAHRIPITGKVQVTLWKPYTADEHSYPLIQYKQHIVTAAPLQEISPPGNPADFDYKSYMARRGIYLTISISNSSQIRVVRRQTSFTARTLTKIRDHVLSSIRTNIPDQEARAILLALLVGDRSHLESDVKRQFRRTGLMHLLAISGLHVMMIGLVFYNLLLPLLMRLHFSWDAMEWSRSIITTMILLVYCLITGAPPSVVRALVMTIIVLGGVLAQRTYHPLNALGTAGIFLLALNPEQLFDAGFQLSFAAVGGILTITPRLSEAASGSLRRRSVLYYLGNTFFASVAATLSTMPVTLYHFGQVAFGGLLLNLAAIPVTAVILSGAVITVVSHGTITFLATCTGLTTEQAVHILLSIASLGMQTLHWTLVEQSIQNSLLLITLTIGLLALIHWHRPRIRWMVLILSLFLLTTHVWLQTFTGKGKNRLDVIFFDVGQGDGALVKLPNNRHILVDGGNRSFFSDEGARTILPHLKRFDIDNLEAVIISHPHQDHMGGIHTVMQAVPVQRMIYNGQNYSSRLFSDIVHLADSLDIPLQAVTTGDTLHLDPAVRIQILAPLETPSATDDANETSTVVRLTYMEMVFLFTGDIERHTERELVQRLGDLLPADVVKVPHHGSKTSSIPEFVNHTTASTDDFHTAVISVGSNNKFGLPNAPVLKRWSSAGARLELTTQGAVWLRTDGYQLEKIHWR